MAEGWFVCRCCREAPVRDPQGTCRECREWLESWRLVHGDAS